jgi:protein-S-isoprenylcysteine O-methyltransferase Ste14
MFSRAQGRKLLHVKHDWTTVSVGFTYTAVFYAVLIDFYVRADGIRWLSVSVFGFIVYVCALALRYWAFAHLGRQWAVHLDKALDTERKLISDGPYRLVRHPLYSGAILETIGLSLAFNSLIALALALVTFIPLEMHRAYFEEKFLREIFGDEYVSYRARVWAFLPLPFGKRGG